MRATRFSIVAVLLGACVGCGDDDDVMPRTDSGTPGTDAGGPDGGGAGTYTIRSHFVDPDGMPVVGAFVAADTPAGRFEAQSDASGNVDLTLQASPGDTYDVTVAKERFVILSAVGVPVEEITADRGDLVLVPVVPALDERTMVAVTLTGMPAGGRFCASFDGWHICAPSGDSHYDFPVPTANVGDVAHVFVMDAMDAVVDFVRAPIPATGTSRAVAVTADTTPEVARALDRDMTINLPTDDPMSPLLTATLPEMWSWWFAASEDRDDGRFVGIATGLRREGNTLRIHYTSFDTGETTLRWSASVWTQIADFHSVSFNSFASDPGASVDVLGFARLSAGATLTDAFSWTVPRTGTDTFLTFRNNAHVVFWSVAARSSSGVRIPELPAGYDRSISFPFPGANGDVVLRSSVPGATATAPPTAVSLSPPFPMTY